MFRTSSRRHKQRLAGALLAAGTALATLSACGPVKMGAAAVVGHDTITTAQLDHQIKEWQDAYSADPLPQDQLQLLDPGSLPRSVLHNLITFRIYDAAAARQGISVTRGDVDAFLARQQGGAQAARVAALSYGIPPQDVRDFVRVILVQERLASRLGGSGASQQQVQNQIDAVMRDAARSLHIEVSPRYGRFDYSRLTLDEPADTLSRAAADSSRG